MNIALQIHSYRFY